MSKHESLIDQILREAHEQGKFRSLSSQGKRLRLEEENPFEDPTMRLAHRTLRDAGYSLPWIEELHELNATIEATRTDLARAWENYQRAREMNEVTSLVEERWQQQQNIFCEQVKKLNSRILNHNLTVPNPRFQVPLLNATYDMRSVIQITADMRDWHRSQDRPTPPPQRNYLLERLVRLREYLELFRTYLKPQSRKVWLLTILLLGSIGLQVANPLVLRTFIDAAVAGGVVSQLWVIALLFLVLVIGGQFLSAIATYVSEDVAWTATNALRTDLVLHCLRMDLSFHKVRTPGELIERIDGDVATLSHFFSQFVIRVVGSGILLVGILFIVALENVWVGAALLGYISITFVLLQRFQGIAVPHLWAVRQSTADMHGAWEEWLGGTPDIRANGAKSYVMRRNYELLRSVMRNSINATAFSRTYIGLWLVIFFLGSALALGLGAYFFQIGLFTIGTVYLVFYYTNLISFNLGSITDQLNELQHATAGIQRINELYRVKSRLRDGRGVLSSGPLRVELHRVTFAYEAETADEASRLILQDISFRLEPGKVLGVVGHTGSGKSTLARLLFRFYDPLQGFIRLGDMNIRYVQLSHLRRSVGMVSQEVQLFHGSVRDNLTFWDERITDAQILQVLDELGLTSWYQTLPHGLDSDLASGGQGLSAGEAQLLAFARVFLNDPGLVILDEASSRLDPVTEQLIERAIDRLLHNRTAIVIAHRLDTIQRADEIMVLDHGRIQEYGLRERLANDSESRFFQLLQTGSEEVLR